jgi:hypothetical protein
MENRRPREELLLPDPGPLGPNEQNYEHDEDCDDHHTNDYDHHECYMIVESMSDKQQPKLAESQLHSVPSNSARSSNQNRPGRVQHGAITYRVESSEMAIRTLSIRDPGTSLFITVDFRYIFDMFILVLRVCIFRSFLLSGRRRVISLSK